MSTKYLLFLAPFAFIHFISCISQKNRRTTVSVNSHTTQKTSAGTTETSIISTTSTLIESPGRTSRASSTPPAAVEPTVADFMLVTSKVMKGNTEIKDTARKSMSKQPLQISEKLDTSYIDRADPKMDCYVKVIEINAKSSTFMNADYEAQGQHIFPGAVYYYSEFTGGNYHELTEGRNPIRVYTDLPNITGNTWNIIEDPNSNSIRDGIASLYSRFDNSHLGTMNLRYQTFESNDVAEYSLKISGGASFSGFSIENQYRNTSNSTDHNLTIDAIKPMFTITCNLPYNKNYFKSGAPIDYGKNPVIISSVTYGVRVLANFTLKTKTKMEVDSFVARYNGVGGSGHLDFKYLTNDANVEQTINCYVVGGPGNSTVAFNKEDLQVGLKDLLANATYASARPISYELKDLAGNIIESSTATDRIITRKCVPHVDPPKLQDVIVEIRTGNEDKDHDTHYRIFLRKGIDGNLSEYGDCWLQNGNDIHYDDNTTETETMEHVNRDLTINDFMDEGGGSIVLHIYAGNDTWNIARISFTLLFRDGTSKKIDFNEPFSISEQQSRLFIFNRDFQKQ